MKGKIIKVLILVIFAFGIYGAASLVYTEITDQDVCPQLSGIPACYIILLCLVVSLSAHLFKLKEVVYFIATGLALVIATYGSVMQLTGVSECPKTNAGFPMCYLSFLIFFSLVLLKLLLRRDLSN